jgi:predicted transcriptional regulator
MGRTDSTVARTDSVRIKLSPDMVERLEKLALAYGMPVSTMGAFAVADFINRQENNQELTQKAVMEGTRTMFAGFNEQSIEKAIERALPALVAEISKSQNESPAIDCKATEVAS